MTKTISSIAEVISGIQEHPRIKIKLNDVNVASATEDGLKKTTMRQPILELNDPVNIVMNAERGMIPILSIITTHTVITAVAQDM